MVQTRQWEEEQVLFNPVNEKRVEINPLRDEKQTQREQSYTKSNRK